MELEGIQTAVASVKSVLSFLPGWAVSGIVLALAIIAGLAIHSAVGRITRRALAGRPFALSLIARTHGLSRLTFVTLALALVLPAMKLPPDIAEATAVALRLVVILLVGWIAMIAVDVGATVYLLRFQLDAEDNLLARKHITQMRVLKRVVSTVVILITAGAALMTFDAVRQFGVSLFASAGVAGLVAGFAARPVLTNLIAGIQLAMTQPIRLEDAVIVENEWGWVEEITSTYVVVRLWDWRRLIVPLSYFIEKPFQNWTREGSALIGRVLLYLDYMAPIDRIRAKAAEIAEQSPLWDRKVVNVQVSDAREHTIEVRVLISAGNASAAWNLRCEMREKLIAFLCSEHPAALPRARADLDLRDESIRHAANRGDDASPVLPARAAGAGG